MKKTLTYDKLISKILTIGFETKNSKAFFMVNWLNNIADHNETRATTLAHRFLKELKK